MVGVSSSVPGERIVTGPMTPAAVLSIFVMTNILNYFDRGYISTTLHTLESPDGLNLNEVQTGSLSGAYIIGYALSSVIFSAIMKKYEPFHVATFGLSVWALAVALCGLAPNFTTLVIGRALSGCGEAGYLVCGPPFLDSIAPENSRAKYLGFFFMAIPCGYALGFIFGGTWLELSPCGPHWSYKAMFIMEACMMLPFVVWFSTHRSDSFFINGKSFSFRSRTNSVEDLALYDNPIEEQDHEDSFTLKVKRPSSDMVIEVYEPKTYLQNVWTVVTNSLYVLIIMGYASQTFVVGAFAFFGVQYVQDTYGWSEGQAGIYFGALTAVAGVAGSFSGGYLLDKFISKKKDSMQNKGGKYHIQWDENISSNDDSSQDLLQHNNNAYENPELENLLKIDAALELISILSFICVPLAIIMFAFPSVASFFSLMFFTQLFIFMTLSPVNSVIMWVVPFDLTTIAVAVGIVTIHALGDGLSPLLIGIWLDHNGHNWAPVMFGTSFVLILPVFFWVIAYYTNHRRVSEKQVSDTLRAHLIEA